MGVLHARPDVRLSRFELYHHRKRAPSSPSPARPSAHSTRRGTDPYRTCRLVDDLWYECRGYPAEQHRTSGGFQPQPGQAVRRSLTSTDASGEAIGLLLRISIGTRAMRRSPVSVQSGATSELTSVTACSIATFIAARAHPSLSSHVPEPRERSHGGPGIPCPAVVRRPV